MGGLGLSNDMRVRHFLCIIAPDILTVVSGARLALHGWRNMQFGLCGCLQLGIEHRSTPYHILYVFAFTRSKRELVNGYSSHFRAKYSDL